MATMLDIVTKACRKIGVAAIDEDLESEVASEALDTLNAMLFEWELAGVDTSHTTLTLTDDFPLDAKFEQGTIYMLAHRLAPEFNRPVGFDADAFFRRIQVAYMTIDTVTLPKATTELPSKAARAGALGLS